MMAGADSFDSSVHPTALLGQHFEAAVNEVAVARGEVIEEIVDGLRDTLLFGLGSPWASTKSSRSEPSWRLIS